MSTQADENVLLHMSFWSQFDFYNKVKPTCIPIWYSNSIPSDVPQA